MAFKSTRCLLFLQGLLSMIGNASAYEWPAFPFAPPAGFEGSDAVAHDAPGIRGWATSVLNVAFGEDVTAEWRDSAQALGPAGNVDPGVLVLGRGGSVVLGFAAPIGDGPGPDFAVFENGFRDTFLELAFVEVSSDGIHFVRFPNLSYTAAPVPAFGYMDAQLVYGLAGKYAAGFGTPFDLAVLEPAFHAASGVNTPFSAAFSAQLVANFPYIDLNDIRYVRIVDVVGDGSSLDSTGYAVYDPFRTVGTAGFDLDAIAVLNSTAVQDSDRDGWPDGIESLLGSDARDAVDRPVYHLRQEEEFWKLTLLVSTTIDTDWGIQVSIDATNWMSIPSTHGELLGVEASDNGPRKSIVFTFPASPALLWRVLGSDP